MKLRHLSLLSAFLWIALESAAIAAPITGSMQLYNPSAGTTRTKVNGGQTAVTSGTGAARTIQLEADFFKTTGFNQRTFPDFPPVAQNSEIYSTTQLAETFRPGSGAGAEGSIFFCPRIEECTDFNNATVPGGQLLLGIAPGANAYGGTFRLLRHLKNGSGAWFVVNFGAETPTLAFNPNPRGIDYTDVTPSGMRTGETFNTPMSVWPGGGTNFRILSDPNPRAQIYSGMIAPTVGTGTTKTGGFITSLGDFIGTAPTSVNDGVSTAFKMTTGTVFVSDATPVQGTSMTTGGGTINLPFTSSTAGFDNRNASGVGNIQLVAGGIAYGGSTGNTFFRNTRLHFVVPEPATHAALAAGLMGMLGLARLRRSD